MSDLIWRDEGSVWLLKAGTPEGEDFINRHIEVPDWAWFAGRVVVAHRMVAGIVQGAKAEGLTQEKVPQ